MNLRKLTSSILANGGASYSLRYGDLAGRKGYAVSCHKDREFTLTPAELTDSVLQNYLHENSDLLAMPDYFLGAWIDNGTLYLDVSKRVTSKAEAVRLCREHDQKAYFDLENLKTIEI